MEDHIKYVLTFMEISDAIGRMYLNSTPVFKLGDEDVLAADVIAAAVLSQTNTYLMGTKGEGKTLIAEIVQRSLMNDDALYLRGDKDLSLKDMMIKLNLDGKNESEIYQVAQERLSRPFFVVDELNRCIGLVQNQFLNIADGYIEIRGEKYYLGTEDGFSLMFATGNPPRNGDHTGVFDEDVALLDRIGLMLNIDDYAVTEMDTADIKEARINKRKIPQEDRRPLIFEASRTLEKLSVMFGHYMEVLSAYVYARFLNMKVGDREVNKRQVDDWRRLIVPGSHAAGDLISQASEVSQRMVQEGNLTEALLLYLAGVRLAEGKGGDDTVTSDDLVSCYLETLTLNVRYDRRFLPFDHIRENYDGDVKAYLEAVKVSLKGEINAATLEECSGMNMEAKEMLAAGNVKGVQEAIEYLGSLGSQPIALTTAKMLRQRINKKLRVDRRGEIKKKLVKLQRA
ncbi:MAG: AAA family ATPase [bacterium]|nr:AAA family ATPase [bacterium]